MARNHKNHKRRKWKKKILGVTQEVFAAPIDFVLFASLLFLEASIQPVTMNSLSYRMGRILDQGGNRMVRNALRNGRHRRWFKEDYSLTIEGRRRLKNVLPRLLPAKSWDGSWYLVSYDIPERVHYKRDILRKNLEHIGFGKLHESLWISPINYLGAIEALIKRHHLELYVILSETNRIGEEASRDLADRVWGLNYISNEYYKFIEYWKRNMKKHKGGGGGDRAEDTTRSVIRYLGVLKRDPQLPEELLPDDWGGWEAREIMSEFFRKELKGGLAKIIGQV